MSGWLERVDWSPPDDLGWNRTPTLYPYWIDDTHFGVLWLAHTLTSPQLMTQHFVLVEGVAAPQPDGDPIVVDGDVGYNAFIINVEQTPSAVLISFDFAMDS